MTHNPKTTKARLKVYVANTDGRHEVIMACSSMREFLAASRASRTYAYDTGNEADVAQAMARPGALFQRPINVRHGETPVYSGYRANGVDGL